MTEKWYWVEKTATTIRIGLSKTTQAELGDVSFINLPKVESQLNLGDSLISIEATKAVLDFDTPFAGEIARINSAAVEDPTLLNSKDHTKNWLVEFVN